jgi:hypothetical protein
MARGRGAMEGILLEREGRLGRTAKYSFHGDERNKYRDREWILLFGPPWGQKEGQGPGI